MTRRYVVIGNGIAGQTCAEELRARDSECSIVVIAAERHPLYNRVALPRYLRGQVGEERVLMRKVEDYERLGLEVHLGTRATELDVAAKVVRTDRGQVFRCDALLLATGGRPHQGRYRKLFFAGDRLVGAIIIGPPKGRKKLIDLIRSMRPVEGPREALLDPANLA